MAVVKAMTEKERKLFAIFKSAIQSEREAQVMYQEAMNLCEEGMLKAVLTGFYEDEKRHEKEVMARYHQFRNEFAIEGDG